MGRILKNKLSSYKKPSSSSKHTFGFLIDETDSSISNYLSELEKHPYFKKDSKILTFRKKETPHKYDFSYTKEELSFSKWPIQKEVENFTRHEFIYFFPLVQKWQAHHEVICRLVSADIKFAEARSENFLDWNICLNLDTESPVEFLNHASQFIHK